MKNVNLARQLQPPEPLLQLHASGTTWHVPRTRSISQTAFHMTNPAALELMLAIPDATHLKNVDNTASMLLTVNALIGSMKLGFALLYCQGLNRKIQMKEFLLVVPRTALQQVPMATHQTTLLSVLRLSRPLLNDPISMMSS